MSFPALAIAAAAITEIHRYTGIRPSFVTSLDVTYSHTDGSPVLTARAASLLFGYLDVIEGQPVGIHDHSVVRP